MSTPENVAGPGAIKPWFLYALLILAASCWIYLPVLHGEWLWDDQELIANNVPGHDPSQWWRNWLQPGTLVDYQPVKATAVCLQWFLWGDNTLGYHLTNLALHVVSALLVWRLLGKFGLKLAWLGGLLFAIHPVQVESVAWIAEFKNTLSLPPFLVAMCCYVDYDQRRKGSDYLLALGCFLLAMLCKASMVMFPFVILLYAWWKRGRIGWDDLKWSAPFFGLSLAVGLLLLGLSRANSIGHEDVLSGGISSRLACIGLAIAFYLSKCVWPAGLLPIYPKWPVDSPTLAQFLPWPILAGMLGWFWIKRKSWGRHALLGIGFFLLNLVPVLAFIVAKYQDMTWSMDHLIYLPIIGLIGLAVAAGESLGTRLPPVGRSVVIGLAAVAAVLLTWESHRYAKVFFSPQTLFAYTLRYNPDAVSARNNLGDYLQRHGRIAEAIEQYRQALRLKPGYAEAHNNLGNALVSTGDLLQARAEYAEALRLAPRYIEAYNGLGNVLVMSGRTAEAIACYQEALKINPDYPEAHNGLASALLQSGRLPEARAECEQALQLDPNYVEAHCTLGLILAQEGQIPEAIKQFETALWLNPDDARIKQVLDSLRSPAK